MADLLSYRSCLLVSVLTLVASFDRGEGQSLGTCYSTRDCSGNSYSAAGGRWTKTDCCSLGGHPCWCDENSNRCQPSCGSARQTSTSGPLGKCYPSKDCSDSSYSVAGGRWTKEDCCSVGNKCWCDEASVCRPSCGSESSGTLSSPLGSCYSSKYCKNSYSRAGGQWTKSDCCSVGNPCWCDQSGRCQSSCSSADQQTTSPLVLGKCYSSSTCESYSVAGGKWTKEDCCSLGHRCWCDEQRQCHPSCVDSTARDEILGKCYSSSDCQSYSAINGKWSQKDCCASGNPCWCDTSGACHASCSSPPDGSDHVPVPWPQATNPPTQSSGRRTTVYWWCFMSLIVIWPLLVCAIYCVVRRCQKCEPRTVNNNINYVQINTDPESKCV